MLFPSTPIASTSKGDSVSNPGPAVSSHQRLLDQREILDRLGEGEGIPNDEWDGVVEKCYLCNEFMLEAVFKDHSWSCWHMSDEEPESGADEWGRE